jgi:Zn-finger nucleic acid-binding protein
MGPVHLDACLACAGAWMDPGGFQTLARSGPKVIWRLAEKLQAARKSDAPAKRSQPECPVCHVTLARAEYASLPELSFCTCPVCRGFWVDTETLNKVAYRLALATQRQEDAGAWKTAGGPAPPAARRPLEEKRETPTRRLRAEPEPVPEAEPCPGCGQANPRGTAVCWACGYLLFGAVTGRCPRCSGAFHRFVVESVEVGLCDGCGGAWLEEGRLGALLQQSAADHDALLHQAARVRSGKIRQLNGEILCPKCGLIMFATRVGMVSDDPVATCPQCRACFLDHDLLEPTLRSSEYG